MPHPRLGLPVYTMLRFRVMQHKFRDTRCSDDSAQDRNGALWMLAWLEDYIYKAALSVEICFKGA